MVGLECQGRRRLDHRDSISNKIEMDGSEVWSAERVETKVSITERTCTHMLSLKDPKMPK